MTFRRSQIIILLLTVMATSYGQQVNQIAEKVGISFRGLSVVNDNIVWVSGSKGTVGRSIDGGESWKWIVVDGYESTEFRDIEAFDGRTALIMGVGEPGVILRTVDGGSTWKIVYENSTKGIFLDAMDFQNELSGVVIGDPIQGRFFIAETYNAGKSWKEVTLQRRPLAGEGEACFAASGTNVQFFRKEEYLFVSGGSVSRLFRDRRSETLALAQGKESQGANSVAVWNMGEKIAIVGGDFAADSIKTGNCIVSRDGGKSWIRPSNPPNGYRSCVEYIDSRRLITCGINGVDISLDEGVNWNAISLRGFNVCQKSRKGVAIFFAGNARIGKLEW